ncbi:MAG: alpha/beta fold hydrolase [Elusimicrobiota bacterium]
MSGGRLFPKTGCRLDLGGHSMHYMDEGRGPVVLMLHGNPTWSFYYRELVAELSKTHRCIAPDHIGMGLSDRPDDSRYRYTLASRVRDLDILMERVAPQGPVTLIVHDWGGMIGMSWAVRHPGRIKAIVASNTSCFRLPSEKPFPGLLRLLRWSPSGLLLRLSRRVRRRMLETCTVRGLSAQAADAYLSVCDGWSRSRALQRFVQDIPLSEGDPAWDTMLETESKLEAFRETPMLLVWGMKDWVFDRAFLDGWIRRFPKAMVRRFEDCGHFLLEDAPESAVSVISDFVGRDGKG